MLKYNHKEIYFKFSKDLYETTICKSKLYLLFLVWISKILEEWRTKRSLKNSNSMDSFAKIQFFCSFCFLFLFHFNMISIYHKHSNYVHIFSKKIEMIIDSIHRLRMLLMLRMTSSEFPVAQYVVVDAKEIRLKFEDSNLKHVYFE